MSMNSCQVVLSDRCSNLLTLLDYIILLEPEQGSTYAALCIFFFF